MLTESINAFILIGICLVIHSTGIFVLGAGLLRRRPKIERRGPGTFHIALLLMAVFAPLILLHVAESCIWAAFYYWRGLFGSYEASLYFSLVTYTTIGYGDALLPEKWRLLGALEGVSGVLLCGLSTAFLFSVVNALFQFRIQAMNWERDLPDSPLHSELRSEQAEP